MFKDIMGIVIDTEDKWLNKKLNSHICYKGGASEIESVIMPQQQIFEGPTETTSVAPSSSSFSGLEQGSSKVAEARTKLEGALGSLQGLKDGSSGVCSCGKPKGKCNCKGYADGTRSIDELMKEYREKMNAPTENTEKLRSMIREKQKKGYAYGTKMISPMGYYMGDAAVATPQQEQEMMAMAPGARIQATGPTADFGQPSELTQQAAATTQQAVTKGVKDQISDSIENKIVDKATQTAVEAGTETAMQGAKAGLASGLSSGVAGGLGSLAGDVVSGKGITKEGAGKALLQAGLTAALGPVGGFVGGLFAKDGTPSVPPMGYADGTAKMTPEEYQMKFIKERIVEPAEAYVEERPMLQAPLLMASAARDYERGKLPLGKFGGGKLEGGKDRLAYRHKKYGDFEVNPESERVSYKKTFRF